MGTSVMADVEKLPNSSTTSPLPVGIELTTPLSSEHPENESLDIQCKIGFNNHEKDETRMTKRQMDANSTSGNKRPRIGVDDRQPLVHIAYNFLPRESQLKLEELLQSWSRWHSQNCSLSNDSNVTLESGDKTYFPALRIGSDKPSDVTFWVDNQTKIESSKEFIQLDSTSVPLYDRGYSLALTSPDDSSKLNRGIEKVDSSRCFNCGSYGHSLKDCYKPRDNAAVNHARKQHKSTRNQHANSRNSIRYYQSSRGGKYEGLAPGVLDVDTRRALGLRDLDPPPWLNRMREIGYPPGYFDSDVDEQSSGITIFGDIDDNEKGAEMLDASFTKTSRKMTVEFPGINGRIPENADERLWAPPPSRIHQPKESSYPKYYGNSSENQSRWPYNHSENQSRWQYPEQRWLNDLEDDGPPGCNPKDCPSLSNHFRRFGDRNFNDYTLSPSASPSMAWGTSRRSPTSDRLTRYLNYDYGASPRVPWSPSRRSPTADQLTRYDNYDYGASPRLPWSPSRRSPTADRHTMYDNYDWGAKPRVPWGPSYGRSFLDTGERSPLAHDGFLNYGHDGYRTFPYSFPR